MLLQDSTTPRYASYSKAYPAQKSQPLITAISWLLLLAALLLAVAVGGRTLMAWRNKSHVLYAVVIDSGSSGTRIYAYNWTQQPPSSRSRRAASSSTSSFPTVQAIPPLAAAHLVPKHASKGMYNRVETRPGLDAFAAHPAGLSGALGPLLAWAQAVVPSGRRSSTPLFFMGTGGLRRLPAGQQEVLLAEIRQQLGKSGFRFDPSWARMISGDDEGAFGWLALNYQQGRLRPHSQTAATAAGSPAVATSITSLGALDLGGSSLQITFEVPASPSSSSSSSSASTSNKHGRADAGPRAEYNISVAGHTFQLHLHSFKQYGLNEAYDRSITYLLQQQQQQEAALQQQDVSAQHASSAAGNGTEAASVTVPPAKPALGITGNASLSDHPHDAVALGAAIQHGLSNARAAGAHADTDAAAVLTSAEPVLTSAEPQHAAAVEQQRQADLAVAAAAGYHQHDMPLSTVADTSLDSLQASSSEVSAERARSAGDSSTSSGSTDDSTAVFSSGALQGSSSHAGLQSASSGGAALAQSTAQPSAVIQLASITSASPGLQLQGGKQPPAAVRRRASGRLRRALMQQQLAWLEQLLNPSAAHTSASSSKLQHDYPSTTATSGVQLHHHHQQQQDQRSHDIKLRQLLREYLLRDDPAPPSSGAALANVSSSQAMDYDSTVVAPHPLVPADGPTSSSSGVSRPAAPAPVAVQERTAPDGGLGGNVSSKLQVVRHPCLHEGYEAVYTRVAYAGVTPKPAEVLLRGAPNWEACLVVVNSVVNASAPCARHEHLPACVLGTPQPELQGNFMALTGFYVVSRFLGVHDSRTLEPLLNAAKTLCSRPWPWVQEHLGSNVNVERYCTWGPYVVKLLLNGLGLEEQHVFIAQDGDLGWPLGAVLVEASKLPGFSPAAAGSKQWQRHRKHGGSSSSSKQHTSLRGSATVLSQAVPIAATALAQSAPAAAAAAAKTPPVQDRTAGGQQLEQQPGVHGPPWSLGLLHHNQSTSGVHLSGPGWVVVLGVAWLVIVGWCRGVCGPKTGGPVAFLPLTGVLSSTAGPGRAHVSGYIGRGKISPNRSSFKLASQ